MRPHLGADPDGMRMARRLGSVFVLVASLAYGYGADEHTDITQKAINNYLAWSSASNTPDGPLGSGGHLTVSTYRKQIEKGAVIEDNHVLIDPPTKLPYLEHYYDPITGLGLWGNAGAPQRAMDSEHWQYALDCYEVGNYETAFWTLGRVMHLVEDMGVPAHTNLDAHVLHEWYEKEYIVNPANHLTSNNLSIFGGGPHDPGSIAIMLAFVARQFDSDGITDALVDPSPSIVKGTTTKVNANDGWTAAEGRAIANECYVGAIDHAASTLYNFIRRVEPKAMICSPVNSGAHSGLLGIPLRVVASSYPFTPASQAVRIERVLYEYSEVDDPQTQDWETIIQKSSRGSRTPDPLFSHMWYWGIDDNMVWIRARAYDKAQCRSCLQDSWCRIAISIDSTNPIITNILP